MTKQKSMRSKDKKSKQKVSFIESLNGAFLVNLFFSVIIIFFKLYKSVWGNNSADEKPQYIDTWEIRLFLTLFCAFVMTGVVMMFSKKICEIINEIVLSVSLSFLVLFFIYRKEMEQDHEHTLVWFLVSLAIFLLLRGVIVYHKNIARYIRQVVPKIKNFILRIISLLFNNQKAERLTIV